MELGWEVLARNWRRGRLEVDLVARDGMDLVLVEVKTRRSPFRQVGTGWFPDHNRSV